MKSYQDYIRVTLPLREDEDKALRVLTRFAEDKIEFKREIKKIRSVKGTLILRALIDLANAQLGDTGFQKSFLASVVKQIEKDGR